MIHSQMIFLDVEVNNKNEALQYLVNKAEENGLIFDHELFLKVVKKREEKVSTAMEFNIAIPHGKSDTVIEPFIGYMKTKKSFHWDEDSPNLVQYIFLIGVPQKNGNKIHLKYISEVSRKLIDDDFRRKLFNCKSVEETYDLLNSINKEVKI
ncbi:PTS sugar transporter subunit IIA [Caldifermentibacillus hisashii]|uniref:PTS sugar transporter subunit IIA n=1 Tax=Caldifermentibacillus hisashii TaxID=996558 RepID=UPI0034D4A690